MKAPKGKPAPVKEAEAPAPEIKLPPTPEVPPRPVEQGKIVYLKLSELHPFHTLRDHPFKVQDDKAMDDLVGTIKEHGIMTPATVRPEKDGKSKPSKRKKRTQDTVNKRKSSVSDFLTLSSLSSYTHPPVTVSRPAEQIPA